MSNKVGAEQPQQTMLKELTDTEERLATAIAEKVRAAVAADRNRHEKRIIHAVWEVMQNIVAVVKRLQQ